VFPGSLSEKIGFRILFKDIKRLFKTFPFPYFPISAVASRFHSLIVILAAFSSSFTSHPKTFPVA